MLHIDRGVAGCLTKLLCDGLRCVGASDGQSDGDAGDRQHACCLDTNPSRSARDDRSLAGEIYPSNDLSCGRVKAEGVKQDMAFSSSSWMRLHPL